MRVLIPCGGWSALTGMEDLQSSTEAEAGTWAQPQADRVFVDTLKHHLAADVIKELSYHINDPAFADACVDELIGLLQSR